VTDPISCLPRDVFYLRSNNCTRAAGFRIENLLGIKCAQLQCGFWQMNEKQTAYVFRIPKIQLTQFLTVFEEFAIKDPKILLLLVMLPDKAKRQVAKSFTVF
jgi:hypothetical protein